MHCWGAIRFASAPSSQALVERELPFDLPWDLQCFPFARSWIRHSYLKLVASGFIAHGGAQELGDLTRCLGRQIVAHRRAGYMQLGWRISPELGRI